MRSGGVLAALLIAGLATLMTVFLVVLLDQVDHLVLFTLVPVMLLIGIVPIVAKIWRGTFDLCEITVPYFALFFLFYGVGAILVLYVRDVAYDSGVAQYLDAAVALCTLGLAALMIGYALAGGITRNFRSRVVVEPSLPALLVIYGVGYVGVVIIAILGHAPARLGGVISGVTSLITQLSFLATLVTFYLVYKVMSRTATAAHQSLLLFVILPSQVLALFLNIGNKTFFILTLGLPVVAYWYARRRVPWKTLSALTLVIVFFVFPFYYKYRNIRGAYLSHEAKVEKSLDNLMGPTRHGTFASEALDTVARRIAIINSTAVIIRECGHTVDYQRGSTLWLGVISIAIPRVLWPDKPTTMIGTEFGKTFRITGSLNYSAISLSTVGELYWNFHVPGVIIGMLLLGACMRAIYQRFGANMGANPLSLAMYVTLLYTFLQNTEGSIGGLEGVLIKQVVIFLVVEKALVLVQSFGVRRAPIPFGTADAAR